jgi:hypothetical protein
MNTRSVASIDSALNHRSGIVPIDFGSTAVSGMHITIVAELRNYFGLEAKPVKLIEPYQMLGEIDDELARCLGIDTAGVAAPKTLFGFANEGWREWLSPWGLEILVPRDFVVVEDGGALLIFPEGDRTARASGRLPEGGFYFDSIVRQGPLDDITPEDNLEEFQPLGASDIEYYRRSVAEAAATGRAVVMTLPGAGLGDIALVPAPFLKAPRGIRDVEEWYVSTVTRQDYLHEVFDRQTTVALSNFERIHEAVGETPAVVMVCGTDFGTQSSTFCSEETFRSLYLPYYLRMNDWIHAHTSWKTFKHSCGAVAGFIPLFIEAGFDILNPVQLSAEGMDAQVIKREYGDRIVFWGGGVDTQRTLPFGTPAEVEQEVKRRVEILGRDGGYVFNAIHNVQAKTPVENIAAMFRAVRG